MDPELLHLEQEADRFAARILIPQRFERRLVGVPPGTWRGYEAGPEALEILVIGAPNLGEAPREDVAGQRDWWAD